MLEYCSATIVVGKCANMTQLSWPCRHSPLHHFCWWNKFIANPIKKYGYVGKGRTAMSLLKNEIMDKILLRRTKLQCADVLALPPRCVGSQGRILYMGCRVLALLPPR